MSTRFHKAFPVLAAKEQTRSSLAHLNSFSGTDLYLLQYSTFNLLYYLDTFIQRYRWLSLVTIIEIDPAQLL